MRKPWVVGLLSVVPGLGLIALGKIIPGLGVMAGMSFLLFLLLITTSADLGAWLVSFALILWMLQLGYAVLAATTAAAPQHSPDKLARRKARRMQRDGAVIQASTTDVLTPLLISGEQLRIALNGRGGVDARMVGELLLALLATLVQIQPAGDWDTFRPPTCIGITEHELVFVSTRRPPRHSDLRRVPLGDVSFVEFKKGRSGLDKLVLRTGRRNVLRIYTTASLRPAIQELSAILGD